jgi:hypothetical protein
MDMEDMLDVIHYFFEEDIIPVFIEKPQETKSNVRSRIYETLYDRPYANMVTASSTDDIVPTDALKPYIPPTNPEDFDKVLGAPMGG